MIAIKCKLCKKVFLGEDWREVAIQYNYFVKGIGNILKTKHLCDWKFSPIETLKAIKNENKSKF